jgi:hypothetical protein
MVSLVRRERELPFSALVKSRTPTKMYLDSLRMAGNFAKPNKISGHSTVALGI